MVMFGEGVVGKSESNNQRRETLGGLFEKFGVLKRSDSFLTILWALALDIIGHHFTRVDDIDPCRTVHRRHEQLTEACRWSRRIIICLLERVSRARGVHAGIRGPAEQAAKSDTDAQVPVSLFALL